MGRSSFPLPGEWVRVEDEPPPPQGERVLLKIKDENCPVVGYWGCGEWEVCTVNLQASDCSEPDFVEIVPAFEQDDVIQWMRIKESDEG